MATIDNIRIRSKNQEMVIGSAEITDAEELLSFVKQVDSETDFLLRTPGEFDMTLKEEQSYIENARKRDRSLFLVCKLGGKIVGTVGFAGETYKKYRHKGEFGISVLKDYWGLGIGTQLIKAMMEWADDAGLVRISLNVDATNERAVSLYEKLGFKKEGVLKDDIMISEGVYRDSIIMARISQVNQNRYSDKRA